MLPNVIIKVRKKSDDVKLPRYETVDSAGCDVLAEDNAVIEPGGRCLVSTGLFLEVPRGYECQVRPRSGMALHWGVTAFFGTIDSDFRGEVKVLVFNTGKLSYSLNKGDRIAQLVFAPVARVQFSVVESLDETVRGEAGWGSTGE